jgi:ABC-2 type transport system ATP-binding protein
MKESKDNNNNVAINVKNLGKTYPGHVALDGVTFSVKKGSIHGFLGPNGAGKSTTMKILCGLIKESSGEFEVFGRIGFLPEHPPVYPNMSVQDYLEFVFAIYAPASKNKSEAVINVMNKTGLKNVAGRLIGNLSKGYQQRVGIAQALVHSPEIIVLDEPTVGLDPVALADIRALINELKNEHTILFSTHQLHDVELLCSDITLINHGRIVVSGALEGILENLKTRLVIDARVVHFSESDKSTMIKRFPLESIEYKFDNEKKNFILKITALATEIIKKDLAHFLAAESIGLLEFSEFKLDLEELFKQMVH